MCEDTGLSVSIYAVIYYKLSFGESIDERNTFNTRFGGPKSARCVVVIGKSWQVVHLQRFSAPILAGFK